MTAVEQLLSETADYFERCLDAETREALIELLKAGQTPSLVRVLFVGTSLLIAVKGPGA